MWCLGVLESNLLRFIGSGSGHCCSLRVNEELGGYVCVCVCVYVCVYMCIIVYMCVCTFDASITTQIPPLPSSNPSQVILRAIPEQTVTYSHRTIKMLHIPTEQSKRYTISQNNQKVTHSHTTLNHNPKHAATQCQYVLNACRQVKPTCANASAAVSQSIARIG